MSPLFHASRDGDAPGGVVLWTTETAPTRSLLFQDRNEVFGGNRIQFPDAMSGTESWNESFCRAAKTLRLPNVRMSFGWQLPDELHCTLNPVLQLIVVLDAFLGNQYPAFHRPPSDVKLAHERFL